MARPQEQGLTESQFEALMQRCFDFHSGELQSMYANNPGALELQEEALAKREAQYGPAVIACLQSGGFAVDDDAPKAEWRDLALSEAAALTPVGQCVSESGYIVDGGIY